MTSRYRLPDWLGGAPVARILLADSGDPKVTVLVATEDTFATVGLDRAQLVEVHPPLPPEPENGFLGIAGTMVWERRDSNSNPEHPGRWFTPGHGAAYKWREVCDTLSREQLDPLVRLIPGPTARAPELPYEIRDQGMTLLKAIRSADGAILEIPTATRFSHNEMKRIACMLWRAAHEEVSDVQS